MLAFGADPIGAVAHQFGLDTISNQQDGKAVTQALSYRLAAETGMLGLRDTQFDQACKAVASFLLAQLAVLARAGTAVHGF